MGVFHVFKIVQMVPNRATHQIYQTPNCFGELELSFNENIDTSLDYQKPTNINHRKASDKTQNLCWNIQFQYFTIHTRLPVNNTQVIFPTLMSISKYSLLARYTPEISQNKQLFETSLILGICKHILKSILGPLIYILCPGGKRLLKR